MAQEKRIYILMIKINRFSLFLLQNFLKEIENTYFMFLWSYRNTPESLGELIKSCGNTHLLARFPQHVLFSQTSTCVSIKQLDYELEISIT